MITQRYSNYKINIITSFLLGLMICCTIKAKAQLNPLATQYFQNQYLANPAMAGINEGLNINLAYSKQGIGIDGSQSQQAVSADYLINKVGLGINVLNNYSGLFRTTSAYLTYAYHVPIAENNQKLSFGLSGGVINQRIQTSDIIGDQGDLSVARYNQTPNYLDGGFGISYTSNKLTIQGSLPDLKTLFKSENTPESDVFFAAVSYKFLDPEDVSVEPKVALTQIRGFNNVVDAGVNVAFKQNAFSLQGIYHSSNSATFGGGLNKSGYAVFLFYTTNTASLGSYNSGDVELSLKINLSNHK